MREDWIEVELGLICDKAEKVKRKEKPSDTSLIYLDIGGIDNSSNRIVSHKTFTWADAPSRAQQVVRVGDVLFSTVRTYLKNTAQVIKPEYDHQICSSGFTVIRGKRGVLYGKFIFYLSLFEGFLQPLNELQTGTSYPAVRDKDVFNQRIMLPSVPEQRAIVAKIEQLFSELDNGVENLNKAKEKLEIYRQAVLKKAFEGEFVTKVSDELSDGWKYVMINSLCEVVRGGSPRPAGDKRYYDGSIPFLKVADLTKDGEMYVKSATYSIKEEGLKKTRLVKKNTLLLTNSGATLGVPKICTFDTTFNDGIAAFLNLDEELLKYCYYFWISKTRELRNINQGAAQPNLNTTIIGSYLIPIGSTKDMNQTLLEIESRLSVCDNILVNIDEGLEKAEALRQSILKKAFEGKLLSQKEIEACKMEPDWESAEKLLEKIKMESK